MVSVIFLIYLLSTETNKYSSWGCQRRSRSLGVMLNNEMDDFAVANRNNSYGMPPSPANSIKPGLQPLSSMVPSLVVQKQANNKTRVNLVLGGAGGTKITTQVALVSDII